MWWQRSVLSHTQKLLRSPCKPPWIPSPISYSQLSSKKGKLAPLQERRMRDRLRLWAKGGEGGNGCWSHRRSRTERHGKPDGGSGGRGGDVILECSPAVWDFSNLQHHVNAKKGGHGVSKNKIGSRGSDKIVQVPVGTVIHLVSGDTPSLVENSSIKSSDPWEIPGPESPDKVEASDSLRHSDKKVSATGLLRKQELQNLPALSKGYVENIAGKHHMTLESCDPCYVEGKACIKDSLDFRKKDFTGIIEKGCDEDKYDMEQGVESEVGKEKDDFEEEREEDFEEEEEEIKYSVAELIKPGQRVVVARGGEGGLGNASLKKDNKPRKIVNHNDNLADTDLDCENNSTLTTGMPGSEAVLILELKSIADVGLVGMPNAGKSTLLGAISRAKPTVGHYAFTTLRPNIGNLNYDDYFSVTVADIPGLIKGAHENRGLGHAFLRHIERTKVLAYVVDLAATLNGQKGITPWEQLRDLVMELEHHQEGLSHRPSLVVANKIDEDGANSMFEELKKRVEGVPIFPVCAILEEGVPEVKAGLRRLMDGSESQRLDLDRIRID